ncbi:hypothetical protein QAD02_011240 [Eretmocerus hayati]|uniref:Uncharacterized protein n=1 Tax=Eretmocerus hayati TaxID=131215 RepID=A0ACC2NYR0_9HYME|nr:hypothetical protein QAD02_011240 [Eretmocerus hayati]
MSNSIQRDLIKPSTKLTWILRNPNLLQMTGEWSSDTFHIKYQENDWNFRFTVSSPAYSTQPPVYGLICSVYLCSVNLKRFPITVEVDFSILHHLNSVRNMSYPSLKKVTFSNNFEFHILNVIHHNQAITSQNLLRCTENGELKILCQMTEYAHQLSSENDDPINGLANSGAEKYSITHDFAKLLNTGYLSDVTLVVGKREFPAHKLVLSTRSPVFRAMFGSNMLESVLNRVNIDDVSHDVMNKLLSYLYTDQVPFIFQSLKGLYAVAEKYQLDGLKLLCSEAIIENLNESNIIEYLILADFYGANELKGQILNFLAKHSAWIPNLIDLDELNSKHADLLKEILITICKSKNS